MDTKYVSPIIYSAIEILKTRVGGTKIELLSDDMFRTKPDEFCKLGELGVYLNIEGVKVFFSCRLAEDIICNGLGLMVADEFVYTILKEII